MPRRGQRASIRTRLPYRSEMTEVERKIGVEPSRRSRVADHEQIGPPGRKRRRGTGRKPSVLDRDRRVREPPLDDVPRELRGRPGRK